MIRYTTEQPDSNTLRFHFTLPADEFEEALDQVYASVKDQYEVPGMRRGRASRKMVENHFGRDVLEKPALDQIVTSAYQKAASEYTEEIYYSPSVRVEQKAPGKDLLFTATVRIRPEVKLCDYRAVKLTPEDLKEADEAAAEVPQEQQENTRLYLLQSALVAHIAEKSQVEVPDTMINERAFSMARALEQRLQADQKTMDDYFEECHTDRQSLLKEFAQAAERQLRDRLTLQAIAGAEGLEATQEEYDAEVKRLSDMYLMPVEKLREFLARREEAKIRQDISIAKAADWVAAQVRAQIAK